MVTAFGRQEIENYIADHDIEVVYEKEKAEDELQVALARLGATALDNSSSKKNIPQNKRYV